ncbi:hypothetical protein KJ870_05825 [bacterium]|nr:hypothetical protein [bacterium]MBU1434436.1 hypothetical protein [bacterium]MBU1502014.1 hypothetical protein [bacterium]
MRFTLIKDLKHDAIMKPVLGGLLFFILLYLVADLFVKQSSFGLTPNTVKATLFGNEEEFLDPLSKAAFLEFWHMEIFFSMMLLFTLSAVYIRMSEGSKKALVVVNLLFISTLVSLFSLFIAYFFKQNFVTFYLLSFHLWHITALFCSLYSLKRLYFA